MGTRCLWTALVGRETLSMPRTNNKIGSRVLRAVSVSVPLRRLRPRATTWEPSAAAVVTR
jgi:hypothetical protein